MEHYFFECPKYVSLRADFLTSIRNLLSPGIDYNLLLNIDKKYVLNLLLRGSPDLTAEENEILF